MYEQKQNVKINNVSYLKLIHCMNTVCGKNANEHVNRCFITAPCLPTHAYTTAAMFEYVILLFCCYIIIQSSSSHPYRYQGGDECHTHDEDKHSWRSTRIELSRLWREPWRTTSQPTRGLVIEVTISCGARAPEYIARDQPRSPMMSPASGPNT